MYLALLLLWLVWIFPLAYCWSSVAESEVNALHDLYTATKGESWTYDVPKAEIDDGGQPWNFSLPANATDPCVDKWFGVKCTSSAEDCVSQPCSITRLAMVSYNMQGTLPISLTDLTSLNRISLSSNKLSGSLPTFFGVMTKIYYLTCANNKLTGTIPESYTRLLSLQRFDAYSNFLTGTIPASLGDATALSILTLHSNLLSGSYPSSLAANTRLRYVEIMRNVLSGSLPEQFGGEYIIFKASSNILTGRVPSGLVHHTHLDLMYLDDNYITGTLPYFNLSYQLESLHLENNVLSGSLPTSFSMHRELQTLQLSQNILSGSVPYNFTAQYMNMYMIALSSNRLSGTLPDDLLTGAKLVYVYLHENKFYGSIPNDLFHSLHQLEQLTLYNNRLSGTVPASLGDSSTLTTLLLQDNRLTGHIGDIFRKPNDLSLTPFPSLQLLDISSNRFSGTVPVEIFSLPNIRHVAIIKNCFSGSIAADICDAVLLEGLLLEGLRSGEECRGNIWDPAGLTNSYFTSGIEGSIPECIFSLPNLNTLHITGNRLSGTIPSSVNMSKLVNLKLSDNRLSGRIPVFLQSHAVASVDLSRNRFMGSFSLSRQSGETTSLKLSVNRLSGHIARGFETVDDIDVLKGNLFECDSRSDIPSHDPDSTAYVCGSDQLDAPLELWLIMVILVLLLATGCICLVYVHEHYDTVPSSCHHLVDAVLRWRSEYSQWMASLSRHDVIVHYELSKFVTTLKQLRLAGGILATAIVVCFGIIYFASKEWGDYGTHVHQYRWVLTAAYLTGLLPALLMLGVLTVLLFFVLRVTYSHNKKLSEQTSQVPHKAIQSDPLMLPEDRWFDVKSYGYIISVSMMNIVLVLFVKGVYVYLLIWKDISYSAQIAANVALSLFDVLWNAVVVTKAVSIFPPLVRNKIRIRWHLLLLLFNSIVAPMISAACTDRNCFVEIFVGRDPITSKSQYSTCSDNAYLMCSTHTFVELATVFTPAYSYSYQCMSSILTNFVPVFLFSHIILGFILPCVLVLCLWLLSSSRVNELVRTLIPHVLLPGVHQSGPDVHHKLMRPGIVMSNILHYFAVMLTFGVAAPLLSVCVAWTIFVMTWIWQLVLGRFVCHSLNCADSSSSSSSNNILESLNRVCTDIWQGPLKAVWVAIDYSLLFYVCLSVDIVGDVRGWLFVLLCVGIPAACVMILFRCMFWCYLSSWQHGIIIVKKASDNTFLLSSESCPLSNAVNADGDVEMHIRAS